MSYLEIYNEQINDLLCPASTMANVRIMESKKLGVQLQGVKEEVVISPQQVYALISAGEAQRHVGSTDANKVTRMGGGGGRGGAGLGWGALAVCLRLRAS